MDRCACASSACAKVGQCAEERLCFVLFRCRSEIEAAGNVVFH